MDLALEKLAVLFFAHVSQEFGVGVGEFVVPLKEGWEVVLILMSILTNHE